MSQQRLQSGNHNEKRLLWGTPLGFSVCPYPYSQPRLCGSGPKLLPTSVVRWQVLVANGEWEIRIALELWQWLTWLLPSGSKAWGKRHPSTIFSWYLLKRGLTFPAKCALVSGFIHPGPKEVMASCLAGCTRIHDLNTGSKPGSPFPE